MRDGLTDSAKFKTTAIKANEQAGQKIYPNTNFGR
jgi:hypothetical protein